MKTNEIHCLICKKIVKGDAHMVLMSTGLRTWTERFAPELDTREDQGWFEVGSDCYRKVSSAGAAGYQMGDER